LKQEDVSKEADPSPPGTSTRGAAATKPDYSKVGYPDQNKTYVPNTVADPNLVWGSGVKLDSVPSYRFDDDGSIKEQKNPIPLTRDPRIEEILETPKVDPSVARFIDEGNPNDQTKSDINDRISKMPDFVHLDDDEDTMPFRGPTKKGL